MGSMPRPRPLYLHRETNRHGNAVWYFRREKGPRIRIKAEYGTPEFNETYDAALRGDHPAVPAGPLKTKPRVNTLAWLVERYKESSAWTKALSQATRKQRGPIFQQVLSTAGDKPIEHITRKAVVAGRDRRGPNAARHFVQAMRGLFKWAVDAELARFNPTDSVKAPKPKTEGHPPWPEAWREAFEKKWKIGTRERMAYEILFCTGVRRGDFVLVGRQHVKNGRGSLRTEKGDESAYFQISERCQQAIDACPSGELTYFVGKKGRPMTKESFGNWFRKVCRLAGVPGSAHGLRKTRATIEAQKGASEAKLNALFGWKTGSKMSAVYIRGVDRERLAFGDMPEEQKAAIYPRTLEEGAGAKAKKRK